LLEIIVASEDQTTLKGATGIFLVLEYMEMDLKTLLEERQTFELKEE